MSLKKKDHYIDFTQYGLLPGDICVSWGSGFFAWVVKILVWLKDGVWDGPTHNMHVHDPQAIASAEISGYKKMDLDERLNATKRVMIFRFVNITVHQVIKLKRLTKAHWKNKTKYDVSLYIIAILRAMIIFIPLILYLATKATLEFSVLVFAILLILYFPLMKKLREWEKVTVACSEAEGELYSSIGLLRAVGDSTNLAPHIWLWILMNRPDVQLVLDSKLLKTKYAKNKN
jgi:hypothetical protein